MLEPENRQALLDALRPPDGYSLDFALGTTYSLDLTALLMIPLAFTFYDIAQDEEGNAMDSVALLEAIRRNSNRMAVFVQAAQIKVPSKKNQLLYAELEKSVYEAQPSDINAVFHPKVWVLRFIREEAVMYRLLCSSRNLTMDRSWDTLLCTEGLVTERERAFVGNHGLGELIENLPKLARKPLPTELKQRINQFAREVRITSFEIPEGFEEMYFWPCGVAGTKGFCVDELPQRLLAVSPFVDDKFLPEITKSSHECFLISREEELRKLSPKTLANFKKVFFLNRDAESNEPDDAEQVEELEGLHAKLLIAEYGWDAWVFSGSNNATHAGYYRNIEFQVGLRGKKSIVGIDQFLIREKNTVRFRDMLSEFNYEEEELKKDAEQEALDREADKVCRLFATLDFRGEVSAGDGASTFKVALYPPTNDIPVKVRLAKAQCWPITLPKEHGKTVEMKSGSKLDFGSIFFEGLTSFFAFEIFVTKGTRQACRRFVVNIPMAGFPQDRSERILKCMIKSADDLLRLILLIVGENAGWDDRQLVAQILDATGWNRSSFEANGLLESLVKSLFQQPWKLDHIHRIISDLRSSEDGRQLIPAGFEAIWDPIWEARNALVDK